MTHSVCSSKSASCEDRGRYAMPVSPLMIKTWSAMHEFWYRLSGGLIGGRFGRVRMLLLTTTGRKSGRPRTTPLLYLEDGGNLVVIASNGGNPNHPAWWLNLKSNPLAKVQVGRERGGGPAGGGGGGRRGGGRGGFAWGIGRPARGSRRAARPAWTSAGTISARRSCRSAALSASATG